MHRLLFFSVNIANKVCTLFSLTLYLTYYNSAEKGFTSTFFNINDKNVYDGILKFSIISLSDITDEQILLTVTFDAKHACEDKLADFEISGSGLTDALTNRQSTYLHCRGHCR